MKIFIFLFLFSLSVLFLSVCESEIDSRGLSPKAYFAFLIDRRDHLQYHRHAVLLLAPPSSSASLPESPKPRRKGFAFFSFFKKKVSFLFFLFPFLLFSLNGSENSKPCYTYNLQVTAENK